MFQLFDNMFHSVFCFLPTLARRNPAGTLQSIMCMAIKLERKSTLKTVEQVHGIWVTSVRALYLSKTPRGVHRRPLNHMLLGLVFFFDARPGLGLGLGLGPGLDGAWLGLGWRWAWAGAGLVLGKILGLGLAWAFG